MFFTFYDTRGQFPVQLNLNSRIIFYLLLPNFKTLTTATKWIENAAFCMPREEARDRMEWRLAGKSENRQEYFGVQTTEKPENLLQSDTKCSIVGSYFSDK